MFMMEEYRCTSAVRVVFVTVAWIVSTLQFYQPLDTITFVCTSAGIEKLPDDARASKHVGAVSEVINCQKVNLLVIYNIEQKCTV
jgi:O-acetyl-ADP-ribose deacetylase (regulator of RNase III)